MKREHKKLFFTNTHEIKLEKISLITLRYNAHVR